MMSADARSQAGARLGAAGRALNRHTKLTNTRSCRCMTLPIRLDREMHSEKLVRELIEEAQDIRISLW